MTAPMPRVPLRLDTVVARRTPVFWYEAVAIVAGATAALTETEGTELSAPELTGIFIDSDGNVTVRPGGGGNEGSATRLARTLHALAPSGSTPAPLRLMMSKWIGSPTEGSIQEFATELAYFARPDPVSAVRAVYERCLAIPAVQAAQDPASPVPVPETPKPKPRSTRRPLVAAAAAAVTAAAAAGAWVAGGSPSWSATVASFDLSAMTEAVRGIRLEEKNSREPSTGEPVEAATPGTGGAGSAAPRQPVPARARAPREGSAARSLAAILSDARPPAPPVPGARPAPTVPSPPIYETAVRITAVPAGAETAARVYSVADGEIEPPSMLYPQLPPPVSVGKNAINSMEVIVSETGAVEHVRLVSTPQRMTDMMLLSGAKTWKFAPASRNGEPVRYRMIVNWAATP